MKQEKKQNSPRGKIVGCFFIAIVLLILFFCSLGPVIEPYGGGYYKAVESVSLMTSREIGKVLIQYSKDHQGHFPVGKSSTEVFQQLIDQGYISDPEIFYFRYLNMPGKVRPESNKLRPENVCFDVSVPVDSFSSDKLPLVFLTGYKVIYAASASGMPLFPVKIPRRTWTELLTGVPERRPFITVCYKDNSAKVIKADDDGSIPNFIPADFDPKGKTYRQLTP